MSTSSDASARALLFAGVPKLVPGADACTLEALARLPHLPQGLVVDAGCGRGHQTLCLARHLDTVIEAVDPDAAHLETLHARLAGGDVQARVRTHRLALLELAEHFREVDLLWSEGAVPAIGGLAAALDAWREALRPGGMAVVSDCSWLIEDPPPAAAAYWRRAYPAMASVTSNCTQAVALGYRVLEVLSLPRRAWWDGYYEHLGPRVVRMLTHADPKVVAAARRMGEEISLFERAGDSYGYVFYLLARR